MTNPDTFGRAYTTLYNYTQISEDWVLSRSTGKRFQKLQAP